MRLWAHRWEADCIWSGNRARTTNTTRIHCPLASNTIVIIYITWLIARWRIQIINLPDTLFQGYVLLIHNALFHNHLLLALEGHSRDLSLFLFWCSACLWRVTTDLQRWFEIMAWEPEHDKSNAAFRWNLWACGYDMGSYVVNSEKVAARQWQINAKRLDSLFSCHLRNARIAKA